MRGSGLGFAHDTFYFFELLHQIGLGLKSSCCICKDDIYFSRDSSLDCVEYNRGWVRSIGRLNQICLNTF